MKNKDNYYVTNVSMGIEIDKFRETGKMSEELGKMFITIATNYANKGNFAGYTWKRDMINDAVYTCVRYAHNFDPDRQKVPNPFAYFTQICYHSFLNYIKKQNKHSKIKDVCYNNSYILEGEDQYTRKAIDYTLIK